MGILLGLDLGTTNCKALALSEDGQPIAVATLPTPVRTAPSSNHSQPQTEFDAEELWLTSARLIREVLFQLGPSPQIAGIAVASIGESGILLDAAHHPLAPIIVWHDPRTLPYLAWWREQISEADLYQITGLNLGHIFSANKLMWYRDHAPDLYASARSFLCIADWISFRLTGRLSMSMSIASRTMLFDIRSRTWSDDLLNLTHLSRELLPPLVPSGQAIGYVTAKAAEATGLPGGTPVVAGGHDHACAALAAGVTDPGIALDSSGTVDAIFVSTTSPVRTPPDPYSSPTCGCHTVKDRYYLLAGVMSGAVVDWMVRLFTGDAAPASVERVMAEAATAPLGSDGVWFQPHLGGSGPPQRDPNAWGAWLGLRASHSRADLVRAGMEGLTFGIRDLVACFQTMVGYPIAEIRVVGGGARNSWWQQLKADILGIPIQTLAVSDVAAQGAGLLAGIGVGLYANENQAAARADRMGVRYSVDPEAHARYDQAFEIYRQLYPALKTLPLS